MSTKIHNGYRLSIGPQDVFWFVERLRETLAPVADVLVRARVVEDAVRSIDQHRAGLPHTPETAVPSAGSPLTNAWTAIIRGEEEVARTGQRNPLVDFTCSVSFVGEQDTQLVLALLFCEQPGYTEAFEAMPHVMPYGYWNNSDRPDDVTEAAWTVRATHWDRLLGSDAPAQRGLTWKLGGAGDRLGVLLEHDRLLEAIPSDDVRARWLSLAQAGTEHGTPPTGALGAWFRTVEAAAEEILPTCAASLAPITIDDLLAATPAQRSAS